MQTISINPAIRIQVPSNLTKNKWYVENFDSRKKFSIPEIAVAILCYCTIPQERKKVTTEVCKFYSQTNDNINALIDNLIEKKLISIYNPTLNEKNIELNSEIFLENYQIWNKHNWGSAAEYHFFTYDYGFLNYSEGGSGWKIAEKRMQDYSSSEPDINRFKTYSEDFKKINLDWPFNDTLTDLQQNNFESKKLDLNKLSILTAIGFAKTNNASIRWNGVPLIRRTSPSGGSRHPTEGYVIINNVENLNSGIYHIQADPFCFTQLNTTTSNNLEKFFPELYNDSNHIPSAIIVLSSIFERNMFRYREPRTFRTIHMDAGHILGTIEIISKHLQIETKITHQIDEHAIEKIIGVDGLSEGVITCIGIF